MKNYRLAVFLTLLLAGGLSLTATAQYDDLYYDPDRDSEYNYQGNYSSGDNTYITNSGVNYDDSEYDYYDDEEYDYYYSSRIRRFHRPYYGFSYFDPVYVDMFYYDPFFTPGLTMLIYDDFYGFNSWNRWNRWNRWNSWNNWGWNSWDPWYGGWNSFAWSPWGYNPWSPWGPRNNFFFGYSNFGYSGFYGGGFYSNFYCPPSWGNGYDYNTVSTVNNTYYGPRTSGTVRVPNTSKRELGIQQESPKDVTNNRADMGRAYDGNSRKDNPGATTEPGLERSRVTPREAETTRSRTFDTSPRAVEPANPRYDRSREGGDSSSPGRNYSPPSQPRRDYTPPASNRNTPRTYERGNSQPSTPRSYERSNSRQSSPRSYERSNSTPRSYERSNSGSSRSSGSYSPSRSSGSSSPRYNSGSSGSSRPSGSSGNSSRSSSSPSRRGGK